MPSTRPNRKDLKKGSNESEVISADITAPSASSEQANDTERTDNSSKGKIDSYFKTAENRSDLAQVLQAFHEKLDNVASQEYLEKKFKRTEELLTERLNEIKREINANIQKEVKHIHKEIANIKVSVNRLEDKTAQLEGKTFDMENTIEKMERNGDKLMEENRKLREEVSQLSHALKSQNNDINDLEQYTRRNSIRIYGLDDPDRKETSQVTTERVLKVLNTDLEMQVQPRDIDIAHRMGTFMESGNRPVICKFVSRTLKMQTITRRRKLKGTRTVIREDLTLKNAKLLEKVSASENVKSAWSSEGKIMAVLNSGKTLSVTNQTDLARALKS